MLKLMVVIMLSVLVSGVQAQSTNYITSSIKKAAKKNKVPYKLLRAICFTESGLNSRAVNTNDGGKNNHAIGLCQVLIKTGQWLGWTLDKRCRKEIIYKNRVYKNCTLYGPYTNAYYSGKYLAYLLKKYNNDWSYAIAAYNAGRVRCTKIGRNKSKCAPGKIKNQRYVDKVLQAMYEGR